MQISHVNWIGKLTLECFPEIFKEHEIDLNVFMTLTDKDLRDIGVSTFGARRTMLMAISRK